MAQQAPVYYSQLIEDTFSSGIPGDICHLNHSSSSSFSHQRQNQGYSIKMVLAGLEKYEVNKKYFPVPAGKFLIVNHGSEVSVEIKSKTPVDGLCFYVSTNMLQDVWSTLHKKPEQLLEGQPDAGLPAFIENIFDCRQNQLGTFLTDIKQNLFAAPNFPANLNEDFFYYLAFYLCQDQNRHLGNMAAVPAQKKSTREELYCRLLTTRDYIHDNYHKPMSLAELSQTANISEFHFLRSFKAVFGESPYQYLTRLRLQIAKQLLTQNHLNIADLADSCGFKEVQSFSKLFRKEFGMGPTAFRNSTLK